MDEALFLGGSLHGQWRPVDGPQPIVRIPVVSKYKTFYRPNPLPSFLELDVRAESYERFTISTGSKRWYVYVHEEVPMNGRLDFVIDALMKGVSKRD